MSSAHRGKTGWLGLTRTFEGKHASDSAVLSTDYLESPYAGAELNAALARDPLGTKAALVPVLVRECKPDDLLRARVYIDSERESARSGVDPRTFRFVKSV